MECYSSSNHAIVRKKNMKQNILKITAIVGVLLIAFGAHYYIMHERPLREIVSKSETPYKQASIVYKTVRISGEDQNTPNKDFQQITTKAITNKPVVYLLFKTGCETCQRSFPIEQEFIKKLPEELQSRVYYVNAQSDFGIELKGKYNIKTNSAAVLDLPDTKNPRVYSLKHSVDQIRDTLTTVFNLLRSHAN